MVDRHVNPAVSIGLEHTLRLGEATTIRRGRLRLPGSGSFYSVLGGLADELGPVHITCPVAGHYPAS